MVLGLFRLPRVYAKAVTIQLSNISSVCESCYLRLPLSVAFALKPARAPCSHLRAASTGLVRGTDSKVDTLVAVDALGIRQNSVLPRRRPIVRHSGGKVQFHR
jgi:hypothetical protein